jgi:hypothetical protein
MIRRCRSFLRAHPALGWTVALADSALGALIAGAVSLWGLGTAWWSVALACASAVGLYAWSIRCWQRRLTVGARKEESRA